MEQLAGKDPRQLSDAEKVEWAKARLAWVALERLEGREAEALAVFGNCQSVCEAYGTSAEWAAVKKWGCARNPAASPCRPVEKTKAQLPPR